MKSIVQMAKTLDISSSTIREYFSRFEAFFPDPVEHEGVKEYPPEAEELIKKIYGYYQTSGMTKEEIRVKLGGPHESDHAQPPAAAVAAAPMDMEKFEELSERMERLITTIENLTAAITGMDVGTFKGIRKHQVTHTKLNDLNDQISDIIELTRGEGKNNENIEKNVLESDGTVIFSFGRLAPNAADSMNFAKAHKKPWLHIDLETNQNPSKRLKEWLLQFEIKVLNVAGKNASKIPGLKKSVNDIISMVLN